MKYRSKSYSTPALVLSYRNIGERDRLVTLVTLNHGKIKTVAKGVRKLTSSKKATLEPGNIVTVFCIITKSLPILTQTKLHQDCMVIRSSLVKLKQLSQILEIIDRLFVNEELEPVVFQQVLDIRNMVVSAEPTKSTIFKHLDKLLISLGYQPLADTEHSSILEYVAAITNRPMKSWDFYST
jgi:DNA repair protein RecO (recombination protein O)